MQTIIKCLFICFFLSYSSIALSDTPEKLTQLYYQHFKNNDWKSLTNMMHDDAISALKQSLIPLFEQEAAQKRSMLLERIYGKGSTLEQAKKSNNRDFYQRSVKNISKMMRNAQFKIDKIKVLGTIVEGDKTHVMVRESILAGKLQMQTTEVFTYQKYKDTWKLKLSGKLANFVNTARITAIRSNTSKK